jgi:hypothetical protein
MFQVEQQEKEKERERPRSGNEQSDSFDSMATEQTTDE